MKLFHKIIWQVKKIHSLGIIAFYYLMKPIKGINKETRTPKVIVSLTTYGKRLNTVYLCIKSLLNQTYKPDEVRLYLGDDVDENKIPSQLKALEKRGLQIISGCENLKPHKKYYYAMKENPSDIIITVDDDVIYDRNLIFNLCKGHEKYPNAIICTRARVAERLPNGKLKNYDSWKLVNDKNETPSFAYLPTGVGGVLYPPGSLHSEVFNKEKIISLILNADDIWLRCMGILNKTPVVCVYTKRKNPIQIPGTAKNALRNDNVLENANDRYLALIEKEYSIRFNEV